MTLVTAKENPNPDHEQQQQQQLPVIIVGAGPCGLVAALALQKYGVPFVIIERASRSKICSNAGSGFELAPTSIVILQDRLGVDVSKFITYYKGMAVLTMDGNLIRQASLSSDYKGGSVNRSEMQNDLLKTLFPTSQDEEGILFCGSGIESYQEVLTAEQLESGTTTTTTTTTKGQKGKVIATLASGESITGCLLLACDGIHSRCRAILHGGYDSKQDWETNSKNSQKKDPLHFCKAICYWGKTKAPRGTDLEVEFSKFQRPPSKKSKDGVGVDVDVKNHPGEYNVPIMGFVTSEAPAGFFCLPSQDGTMLNWAFTVKSKNATSFSKQNDGTDLTRRGGGVLTEEEKKRLFDFTGAHGRSRSRKTGPKNLNVVEGVRNFPLLEKLIARTPAADITEAGLFDRENLNLPFTSESKLVALLGDAAHPQTPYMGQGVNMAICDAYVYATNIVMALQKTSSSTQTTTEKLQEAVTRSDTDLRRKQAKNVVRYARLLCNLSITQNWFLRTLTKLYVKRCSADEMLNQIIKTDTSNREYLKQLDEMVCSPKEQEVLMQ